MNLINPLLLLIFISQFSNANELGIINFHRPKESVEIDFNQKNFDIMDFKKIEKYEYEVKPKFKNDKVLILNEEKLKQLGGDFGPGNGGDGEILKTDTFPKQRLKQALLDIKEVLKTSKYSNRLKDSYVKELEELISKDKISIALEFESFVIPGNRFVGDYQSVVKVLAITNAKKGSNILLSNRALSLSSNELSKLFLEELGHHVLPLELALDEEVVNNLATDFMEDEYDQELDHYILEQI